MAITRFVPRELTEKETEKRFEEVEARYKDIKRFIIGYRESTNPHTDVIEMARRIKKENTSSSDRLKVLEKVADYHGEMAPIRLCGLNCDKRKSVWSDKKIEEIDKEIEKGEKGGGKRKDKRSYDSPCIVASMSEEQKIELMKKTAIYYEGREEWTALMFYGITNPGLKKQFAESFFRGPAIGDVQLMARYYRGPITVNNVLFESVLMANGEGRNIASVIARTLEGIRKKDDLMKLVSCPEGLAMDISRMSYLAGKNEYKSYMSRLKAEDPTIYDSIFHEDPRDLFQYSGTRSNAKNLDDRMKSGLSFSDRILVTRRELVKMLGLGEAKA